MKVKVKELMDLYLMLLMEGLIVQHRSQFYWMEKEEEVGVV